MTEQTAGNIREAGVKEMHGILAERLEKATRTEIIEALMQELEQTNKAVFSLRMEMQELSAKFGQHTHGANGEPLVPVNSNRGFVLGGNGATRDRTGAERLALRLSGEGKSTGADRLCTGTK